MLKSLKALFLSASFLAITTTLTNAWEIDSEFSKVSYTSIKKDHVAETHTINNITGTVSPDGEVLVKLDMASVDSGIDVRDGRLRNMLFKVEEYPNTTFKADVDLDEFSNLEVGETVESFVTGSLNIVGTEFDIDFDVLVTRTSENKVMVTPLTPILLDAETLGLKEGVDALKEIAKLPIISYAVPLTFTLAFSSEASS